MKITIEKKGLVFKPSGEFPWSLTHAQVPFPLELEDGLIRIFFSTRDKQSRSGVSFVDVHKSDPAKVIRVHDKLCLSYGDPGSFDDSGTMPSWFLKHGGKIRMYYTGWNKSESASYRLAIGMAESDDNGLTFRKCFPGPVLDRGINDPVWVGQPCVHFTGDQWKMWYLSCQKIEIINDHPEPFYNVKYAESKDGIDWERKNITCIPFSADTDAIGRPFAWKHENIYFMLHSNRMANGYREKKNEGYRMEMSMSDDGISWKKVEEFRFEKSASGWDAQMNEYASVLPYSKDQYLVFYNGNGFGASGFGVALLTIQL